MFDVIGKDVGRYRIIELIGEGGMAMVYKGHDSRLDREVAIKFIRMGIVEDAYAHDMLKRFDREARSLAKLSHPNIVKVYDYGEYENFPYLVMEYLAGGTLRSQIGKTIQFDEAARLLVPITKALAYAHQQGIVHRDVKPTNILLSATGDPLLSDFGIAKLLHTGEAMTLTGPGASVGTPEYTAPEQSTGKPVDHRADIYSLGVVFYELVTGEKPFTADTPVAVMVKHVLEPLPSPRKFISDLPEEVEKVILKALAKEPNDRYQTMKEFGAELERLSIIKLGDSRAIAEKRTLMEAATSPSPMPVIAIPEKSATQETTVATPISTMPMTEADQSKPVPKMEKESKKEEVAAAPVLAVVDHEDEIATVETAAARTPVSQPAPLVQVPATPSSAPTAAETKPKRQSLMWGAAALVVVCLLAVGGGLFFLRGRGATSPTTAEPTPMTVEPSLEAGQPATQAAQTPAPTENNLASGLSQTPATQDFALEGEPPPGGADEQALVKSTNKQPTSGNSAPLNGSLAHRSEGPSVVQAAGVDVRNFTTQVTFYNPYTVKLGTWDVGFFFRAKGEDEGYHIAVRADSTWELAYQSADGSETVERGKIAKMVMSDTADKANKLTLTVLYDKGYLFINDSFVGSFPLTKKSDPGDVMVETGFFPRSQREGAVTRFEGFAVWPIEEGKRLEDGQLVYGEDLLVTEPAEVDLDNFVMRVFFKVPYSVTIGKWNLGIVFRSRGRNDEYRLIISSTADWLLGDQNPKLSQMTTVSSGKLEKILQLGDNKENELFLIVQGAKGYFFVNGVFVKGLDLSKRLTAGDVAIGAGFYKDGAIKNKTLVYRDYNVWELPQVTSVEDLFTQATEAAIAQAEKEPATPTPKPAQAELLPPVKVFGPEKGDLSLHANSPVQQHAAGINVTDFAAEITFRNPYSAAVGRWDTGFLFRSSGQAGYRLSLRADSTWELFSLDGSTSQSIDSNERHHAKVRTLDNTAGNTNKILLMVLAEKGFLFVNDAYIADMNIEKHISAGDVIFETGAGERSQKDGYSTSFEGFTVWEIGQPGLGPMSGETKHNEDGKTKYRYAGVSVKNFIARATFSNPYASTRGKWDAGFAFRSAANDDQFQLVVLSGPGGSEWRFGNRQPSLNTTTWLQKQTLKGELTIGYPAANELFLFVHENKGFFFLNNRFIGTTDFPGRDNPGDVAVGSGFFGDSEITGSTTKYEGFTLWELP